MAVTPADVKAVATEFAAVDDGDIQPFIDQAERRTNRDAWGSRADDGVIYLTAHLMLLSNVLGLGGSSAGLSTGVTLEKVDDLTRQYAAASQFIPASEAAMSRTKWGSAYLELLALVFGDRRI